MKTSRSDQLASDADKIFTMVANSLLVAVVCTRVKPETQALLVISAFHRKGFQVIGKAVEGDVPTSFSPQ